MQVEKEIDNWVEQQVIHHSDTKYVTVTPCVQPPHVSKESNNPGTPCYGMQCNTVWHQCMEVPLLS